MPRKLKPPMPTVTPQPAAADARSAATAATNVLISLARLLARAAAREEIRAGASNPHDGERAGAKPSAGAVKTSRGRK